MPEGDTLARIARTLSLALVGRVVTRFASPLPALSDVHVDALEGRTITSVTSRGKNLLIGFDDERTLHTHLRMRGSWHLYPRGAPWKKPASAARVVLEVSGDRVAVCFDAPIVRLLSKDALRRDRMLRALGPDLLGAELDESDALARIRRSDAASIAEALLDQRNVAGIGNEYKSELLFLAGIDPRARVASVGDEAILALLRDARALLAKNVEPGHGRRFRYGRRTTRFAGTGPKQWVYDRAGKPCLRCGATIVCFRQGLEARLTFYCPTCQPSAGTGGGRTT